MNALIDARGLSCPQPVLLVQKAIEAGYLPIEALVDTVTAGENIHRLAQRFSLQVQVEQLGAEYKLTLTK
ncbi:MAG: sulfurtransferase TusA family protein [Anaerolineaceae bacterium]|nr:sulfurtransferase TusA family protein [Anaerolineaceae bacterium]